MHSKDGGYNACKVLLVCTSLNDLEFYLNSTISIFQCVIAFNVTHNGTQPNWPLSVKCTILWKKGIGIMNLSSQFENPQINKLSRCATISSAGTERIFY